MPDIAKSEIQCKFIQLTLNIIYLEELYEYDESQIN